MAGPVAHELDEIRVRSMPFPARRVVKQLTHRPDDVDVRHLAIAADVVSLSGPAILEHPLQRVAMIVNVQPVTNIAAVAVNRQRFAAHTVQDQYGDQLFGKLVRSVIVRAMCRDDGHAVGMEIRTCQMVGRGLRR